MSLTSVTDVANIRYSDAFKDYMDKYRTEPSAVLDVKADSIVKVGGRTITGKQLELYFDVLDRIVAEQYPEELL